MPHGANSRLRSLHAGREARAVLTFHLMALLVVVVCLSMMKSLGATVRGLNEDLEGGAPPLRLLEPNREVIDARSHFRKDKCPNFYVVPRTWQTELFSLSDCLKFDRPMVLPIAEGNRCPGPKTNRKKRFEAGAIFGVWRIKNYKDGEGFCVWLTPAVEIMDGEPYRHDGVLSLYVAIPKSVESFGMSLSRLDPAMKVRRPADWDWRLWPETRDWLLQGVRDSISTAEREIVPYPAPSFRMSRALGPETEKMEEDDAPAISAPADGSAPISKPGPPAEPDPGAAPDPGTAPARTAPPSGKVASDRPDDASQICTVDGTVITSAGQDLISRLQAKYVAVLKPNQAEKIDRFATISNEYYDDATIDNPFVNAPEGERQHVVEVRSLKSYDKLKRRTGEVRAAHIGEVILPENRAAKTERPIEIRLRIIATRFSLNLLAPRNLAALIARDYVKRIRFQITYDQIIGPGALAEPRQFSNFEDLASQVTNDPLSLSEQQTGELFELIAQRLKSTSSKHDHVVIAKENWAAPISTAESLLEITKGENANWLSVYSTPTAAHGNSYIRAAMDRTSAGRFYSAAPARGENAIPASRTFVESLYSTAETRSLREGLTTSASEEPRTILVDLYDIIETPGEDTGHVVDAGQMGQFIKKLEQLSRMIQDKLNGTRLAANGISLDHFHRKSSPPFLIVPTSADLSFMRADSLALMTKKSVESMGENINYLMETRAFKVRSLQCDAYFVSDKRLGFAQSLGAGE